MTTLSPAPTTVHSSGQIVATGLPSQNIGTQQNIEGGLINHAAAKTAASIKAQAAHAVKAGVTQRGSGRRRMRGGNEIHVPEVPEGGTIPGASFTANHSNLLGHLNQIKASAVYDKLGSAQPYKVSGGKRRRKTKHGRSKHRNNNRKRSKRSHHTRRRHHSRRR